MAAMDAEKYIADMIAEQEAEAEAKKQKEAATTNGKI